MRKTLALFGTAATLLVTALVIGPRIRENPRPELDPDPGPVSSPEVRSRLELGELVRMEAQLSREKLMLGGEGQVSLLIDLWGRELEGATRVPMAVALVLDRSGSMTGEKMAQAKRAAKQLIERLGDSDAVALISYSNDTSLDVPLTIVGKQRRRIQRAVDDIMDGGGTDLAGGLSTGLDALRRADVGLNVRRVILLSDGNANQGLTDPGAIADLAARARAEGITVSTLGVGVDFNEDLMTSIAQRGGGGYYYARDARAIAEAFDHELSGLVKLAARNVELGFDLPDGVELREVFGYRTERRDGRSIIVIGDMSSGEHRRVMLDLDSASDELGRKTIARLSLSYADASGEHEREHGGALSLLVVDDLSEAEASVAEPVIEAFEDARAARAREAAAASFQAGDRGSAVQTLRSQITRTRAMNKELSSPRLDAQLSEMEDTLRDLNEFAPASDDAKDLVKREKLKARRVFAY